MRKRAIHFRTYLLLANATSLAAILAVLFYCYSRMLLSTSAFFWLGGATLLAGALSFLLHVLLIRPLERALVRIGDASGRIAEGFSGMGEEVPIVGPAEFRQLAERFNAMSRELKSGFERLTRSEAARAELVASVAHDLRTPLALLQSHSEALLDEVVQEEDARRGYLQVIRKETVRLGILVQDLFDLSKLDAGAEPFEPKPVPIEDVLFDALNAFRLKLEAKRLDVDVRLPEPSPLVLGVESELQRIVGNLLDNGIRHSPPGGRLVWTVEEADSGFVSVKLKDEGEGVPEADLPNIFERFYRTDRSRQRDQGGSGLGLAIAKSLVERHGGRIGVRSRAGEGSEFRFTLRRAAAS